jgi:hypothetical protein
MPALLIDHRHLQVGRLDITRGALQGYNQRSTLFKAMFLALCAARVTVARFVVVLGVTS